MTSPRAEMNCFRRLSALLSMGLSACVTLCPDPSSASPLSIPAPVLELRLPCDRLDGCRNHGSSQQPDRRVEPFGGTLGRPCAYRWRPTPSGTRKVRICH
ncbi:hypothetical protein [Methylobacterium sp. 10]|uniref:hypothetical protein n=1 Tax=Methylobacterium sp. 10 TaxID=1101191 RepID=UPI001AEC2D13|nr:hypothetical protein [Methylobacterium sp. 10]